MQLRDRGLWLGTLCEEKRCASRNCRPLSAAYSKLENFMRRLCCDNRLLCNACSIFMDGERVRMAPEPCVTRYHTIFGVAEELEKSKNFDCFDGAQVERSIPPIQFTV